MTIATPATDTATVAKAIVEAVSDNPSLIEELTNLGLPAEPLRQLVTPEPCSPTLDWIRQVLDEPPNEPTQPADVTEANSRFSDQAYACWARMDDGSSFLAIIAPDPVETEWPDA